MAPPVGAIASQVSRIIPVTWHALGNDSRYGEVPLQAAIDLVKEAVFGNVIPLASENTYPLIVQDYVAKLIAIELIPAGIDYWMNQPMTETSTGTNEMHTFTERAEKLAELRKTLLDETRRVAADVAALVGYRRPSRNRPRNNMIDEDFITPSPLEFPRPYAASERT
jgi:hypothetical protein